MSTTTSATRPFRTVHTALALAALTAVTACTPPPPAPEPEAPYTPPAWMAEQLQSTEAFTALQERCLIDKGYAVTTAIDGSISADLSKLTPEQEKATSEAMDVAGIECYNQAVTQHGEQDFPTAEEFYERVVETRACLIAQGYDRLPEPPSMGTWVDAFDANGDVWSPYAELLEIEPDITETEWYRLKGICVESGIIHTTGFEANGAGS